ncbi:MAG TPA: hypothetical protein VEY11_13155 [Pyrinomonadaceae bacterium]|nr:hypothetical protein [Pyrinomonadaceae bacterium]
MRRKLNAALFVLLLASLCQSSLSAQERGPSTEQERRRAVELATSLENEPLGKNAKDYRRELFLFLVQVPDINVTLCTNVLGDPKKIKGDYSAEISGQQIFSQARFIIQNPELANDQHQVYLAGVEGTLRAYTALKQAKPKVKIEGFELLLTKQQAGHLSEFVKSAMSGCKSDK